MIVLMHGGLFMKKNPKIKKVLEIAALVLKMILVILEIILLIIN